MAQRTGLADALPRALAHPGPTVLELPLVVDPRWEMYTKTATRA